MSSVLAGKVVMVTGGTGSIGSEITSQALELGASKVVVLSRDEIKHFLMRKRFADDRLETVVGDVASVRSVEQVLSGVNVDVLYHAAAMKHVVMCEEYPLEAAKTNVWGTHNVVDLALRYGVGRTITISTDKAAYPSSVMGACKFIGERITLNAVRHSRDGQVFCCVRFGNVANSRGSVIPVFIQSLMNRQPLEVSSLEVTRFLMETRDAVRLVMSATEMAHGGEIFVLKMRAFRLGDLVDVFVDRVAPKLGLSPGAVSVRETGLSPCEKLHEDLITEWESRTIYETDQLYVVVPEVDARREYPDSRRARLVRYSSRDGEMVSKEELERIVMECARATSPDL